MLKRSLHVLCRDLFLIVPQAPHFHRYAFGVLFYYAADSLSFIKSTALPCFLKTPAIMQLPSFDLTHTIYLLRSSAEARLNSTVASIVLPERLKRNISVQSPDLTASGRNR